MALWVVAFHEQVAVIAREVDNGVAVFVVILFDPVFPAISCTVP